MLKNFSWAMKSTNINYMKFFYNDKVYGDHNGDPTYAILNYYIQGKKDIDYKVLFSFVVRMFLLVLVNHKNFLSNIVNNEII